MKSEEKGSAAASAGAATAVVRPPKPMRQDRVMAVGISSVDPHPDNPRGKITEADVADLAESIRQLGLLSPIGVVRTRDGFRCLYGHRRLVAARLAGLSQVEVIVFDQDTAPDVAEAIMLADNAQHVAPDPIAEANVVAQLAGNGKSEAEIARLVGKSPKWVATRVALSKLPAKVLRDTLRPHQNNGRGFVETWSLAAVEQLAKETDPKRLDSIVDRLKWDGVPSPGEVLAAVMEGKRRLDAAPWKLDDVTLCPKAGACSACPKTSASRGALFHDEERDAKGSASALCLDGDCWDAKSGAHMKAQLAAVEADAGKKLPLAVARDIRGGVETEGRREFRSHEFSTRKDAFYKKPVEVALVTPAGVKAAKVFVSDSRPASASMPGGKKPKKSIADMKPAEAKKAREERAMQRARSASLDTIIALAREVKEPDPSQAIAASFLFGGRTHGCDEGAYHRPHDRDAKARPAVLKAFASKGAAAGSMPEACAALWRDAIEQAERIVKRRDSQQIKYAITAAQDLAVLIGEDFEAIAKTKRQEIDGKSKTETKPEKKTPKS